MGLFGAKVLQINTTPTAVRFSPTLDTLNTNCEYRTEIDYGFGGAIVRKSLSDC